MPYQRFFNQIKKSRQRSLLLVVAVVAGAGTYLLVSSHAATPYASINADSGTISTGAAKQACAGANDGSCVVFGQSLPMDGNVALSLPMSGTPFAANSFWNTPLPDNAGAGSNANPNSPVYVSDIINQACYIDQPPPADGQCNPNTLNGTLNAAHYSVPFYVVPANQPRIPVILDANHPSCPVIDPSNPSCSNDVTLQKAFGQGVPIPAGAKPAFGSDAHIAVYQPSSDTLWEFWKLSTPADNAPGAGSLPWSGINGASAVASYGDNQFHAQWGGVLANASKSSGIFPYPFAGWTTGLSLLGSIARIEELQAGQVNHAIGLGLGPLLKDNVIPALNCPLNGAAAVNTPGATNGISYPANRSDGTNTDPCSIPEGLRLRLPPPSVFNLSSYEQTHPMTPVAQVIAAAVQKYGFVVAATSDGTVGIDLGDPTPYITAGLPNPYTTGTGVGGVANGNKGLYGGLGGNDQNAKLMANFPWSQLQALPFNYGD